MHGDRTNNQALVRASSRRRSAPPSSRSPSPTTPAPTRSGCASNTKPSSEGRDGPLSRTKPTRPELVRHFANHEDRDLRWIANVIITHGSRVAAKLAGLYALEQRGCEIRPSQFSTEAIVVDGRTESLTDLIA